MKLYFSRGACSLAPHIVLTESGLKFSAVPVSLETLDFAGGNLAKINPKGYVPVLELDNGEILTEVAVICQYIADQVPEKNLIPKAGTFERYKCQEWLNYIATEIHKGYAPIWDSRSSDETKKNAIGDLGPKFDFLAARLEKNEFLMGTKFSVADAYLYTILNWSKFLKMDMTKWPALMSYVEKMKGRPTTMETLKSETSLSR